MTSDPWPTVTSQPIKTFNQFHDLDTDFDLHRITSGFHRAFATGVAYQQGLANVPIVETKFLELAMSLLDFSPRIPLGTFSILILYITQTAPWCWNIWPVKQLPKPAWWLHNDNVIGSFGGVVLLRSMSEFSNARGIKHYFSQHWVISLPFSL